MLVKSMNSINTFINEWNCDEVSNMVYFRINVRTKSMLSITSSKESCFIQIMFSIINLFASSFKLRKEEIDSEASLESS